MIDYVKIKTTEALGKAKENVSCLDQRDALELGCETWGITYEGGQRGQMTVWPNGRGAICTGGDSDYGDWDEADRQLTLDERDEDGDAIVYDESGEHEINA